ncbi:MAG: protein kinase [Pseudomonadota bacterium]
MNSGIPSNISQRFNKLDSLVAQLDDDARIRGSRAPGEGLTTLAARNGKAGGILQSAYNLVAGRGELRKAVERALAEVEPLAHESQQAKDAISAIRTQIRRSGHDLRAGSIRAHLKTLKDIAANRPYPSVLDLPGVTQDADWQKAVKSLRQAGRKCTAADQHKAAELFGLAIARTLDAADPSVRFSFTVSPGMQFKKELMAAMRESGATLSQDELERIAEAACASGLAKMSDHVSQTTMGEVVGRNGRRTGAQRVTHVGAFTMDGVEFTHKKPLGEGGNGVIGLYSHVDRNGQERQLVLKFVKPLDSAKSDHEAFEELAQEAIAHRNASAKSPDGFVKFERAFRMPDGRLAIAMELAPHGDVNGLVGKLYSAADTDSKQSHLMRLTLAHDALRGLDTLQTKVKASHLDLKGANFYIGADGRARMADFGLAQGSDSRHMIAGFGNMAWNDPRVQEAYEPIFAKLVEIKDRYKPRIAALLDKRNKELPAITARKGATQVEQDAAATRKAARDKFDALHVAPLQAAKDAEEAAATQAGFDFSGFKADVWSTGTVLYELYGGEPPFGSGTGQTEEMLKKQAEFLKATPQEREAFLFNRPGMATVPPEIRAIILGMLDPDPARRMSAGDALKSPVFSDAGVGSQATRSAIIAMAKSKAPAQARPYLPIPPIRRPAASA